MRVLFGLSHDLVDPHPRIGNLVLVDQIDDRDEKRRLAAEKSLVNYGFYIGATPHNIGDLRAAHLRRRQPRRDQGGRAALQPAA